MALDALSSSALYFSSVQSASVNQSKEAQKEINSAKQKKVSFNTLIKQSEEEAKLLKEGLPVEIAGMSADEAIIFLKDALDVASENLQANPGLHQVQEYKEKIGNLMKYISRNNYEVLITKRRYRGRPLIDKKNGKPLHYVQIKVIDEKLEKLTRDILYNQSKNLNLLSRLEEINGLIVDLLAS